MAVSPVPTGYHTATPYLIVPDVGEAVAFYTRAFGATELLRLADPAGRVIHAEVRIGDSPVALSSEAPEWGNRAPASLGGSAAGVHLYVEDVDALARRAVEAGAEIVIPIADQFYGDRSGRLADPFGHFWVVATRREDLSAEEMERRMTLGGPPDEE